VKSETQSWFGLSALNCQFTLSSGHGAFGSLTVVCTTLPRITPRRPWRRISRSIGSGPLQPSRWSCRQTFFAP
jgi:hypothetical protein